VEYSQQQHILAPKVMEFVDYREYLRAWYVAQKVNIPSFSYAVWANKAGFKSRSFMRLVMLGKRTLGVDSIPLVLKSIPLHGADAKYFTNLVYYAHSNNFESRDFYFKEILKLSKGSSSLVKDSYRFLAHPKTPRVHLLISLKNFNATLEIIAEILQLPIAEIKDILENLVHLGLAFYDSKKTVWCGLNKDLKIPEELGNLALQSFHAQSLKEAREAIQLPPPTRHYGSLFLFLDTTKYGELKKELDQFSDYLARKYSDASTLQNFKIYQMNLNFIPASQEIIRSQLSESQKSESKEPESLSDKTQEVNL
jgi:uncharacterized protein (TIGR02147 family)